MDGFDLNSEPDARFASVDAELRPYIVVGGGPSGARAAQEIAKRTKRRVILFSDEKWGYYNRTKLTPLLARDANLGQVVQSLDLSSADRVQRLDARRIASIDIGSRTVTEHGRGAVWPYEKLVLATGSRAHRPDIPGVHLPGVFTLRTLDDAEALVARAVASRRAVVIGGGPLGLECARGMHRRGARVSVLEHSLTLMARHLDEEGGALLQRKIEALGIEVRTSVTVRQILGSIKVQGVYLGGGDEIPCDTVILCTGVKANNALALKAGIKIGRGVRVDSAMRTADPHVYAVGECAEFNDQCDGLVAPGLEQARVAAINATGGRAAYSRASPSLKLKVAGADVFSAGDVEQIDQRDDVVTACFRDGEAGTYRRLVIKHGRLIGAIGVGAWDDTGRVQQWVARRRAVSPLLLRKFRKTGEIFAEKLPDSVAAWPDAATVCNCTGVTRGQLGAAIKGGCASFEQLSRATSASTVCGSCKPHILDLLSAQTGAALRIDPARFAGPLILLSLLSVAAALYYIVAPPFAPARTFTPGFTLAQIWSDNLYKQISGYSLLGLSGIAALLSFRKRIKAFSFGDFALWRLIHLVLGMITALSLVVHSGLDMGHNLNFALIVCFLTTLLVGAVGGAIIGAEHELAKVALLKRLKPRRIALWLHIFACWPLPLLLAAHITSVYFY